MRNMLIMAALLAGAAQAAGAISCNFTGTIMLAGTTPSSPGECWDMSGWSDADARSFCTNVPGGTNSIGSQQVAACPAGAVGKCIGAKYRAPVSEEIPAEYYAKMPPAIAAQLKANIARANEQMAPLKRYDGKPITVYYYADPHGVTQAADQQKNCAGKGGKWGQ